jgi:acyl-CoA hydrolase
MSWNEDRARRRATVEDALALVRDGDWIVVPIGCGEPPALLEGLSARRQRFQGVRVVQMLPLRRFDYFDPQTAAHVQPVSMFLGGPSRPGAQAGWLPLIHTHLSEAPQLFARGEVPADVVFALASPMDAEGWFHLGVSADYTLAALERARSVVLEVNPNVPRTAGPARVHVSKVSAWVEDDRPLFTLPPSEIEPVQQAIARHVAPLIEDGDTLQIGIGGIPDAVVAQLQGKRDLGVHSEMIGDGLLSLIESGAVTNRRKNFMPGKMVATFALGSEKLYRFLDRCPDFELHPADFTNDPCIAGQNDRLVSLNATLQVDLLGQCGSESLGALPYSGTGGQSDFVRAANRSRGGKAIMVLPSTAKGDTVSRIVPTLNPGTHVSTGKNDVNYVVTEYGVARLRGRPSHERVAALIAIAHPAFREELQAQARALHLV